MGNTNLKILRINQVGMTPTFDPGVKDYYFVTEELNEIEITAVPEDKTAQVVIEGSNHFQTGKNVVTISVTSADDSQQSEYRIYVTKTSNITLANTNLETLAIAQGTLVPEFNNLITEYEVEVEHDAQNIDILAIPQSMNAIVFIEGNETIEVGDNLIVITVLAEDKLTEKQYRITVHRRSSEEQILKEQKQEYDAQRSAAIIEAKNAKVYQPTEAENQTEITLLTIGIIVVLVISIAVWWRKKKN